MLANYGYKDGSGDYFITVDTGKCTGCNDCVECCPSGVLVLIDDDFDIDAETQIAAVARDHAKRIKYSCAPCKGTGHTTADLPCVKACEPDAITHSW